MTTTTVTAGHDRLMTGIAAVAAERSVQTIVSVCFGDQVFTRNYTPGAAWPERDVPDALLALHALTHLAAALPVVRNRYVTNARAAGTSWHTLGAELGLTTTTATGTDDGDGVGPGDGVGARSGRAAFWWALTGATPGPGDHLPDGSRPSLTWTCGTCGAPVTDHGPAPIPVGVDPAGDGGDEETGHTPDCPRHTTALTDVCADVRGGGL